MKSMTLAAPFLLLVPALALWSAGAWAARIDPELACDLAAASAAEA
jgi:hypothetical protein